MKPLVHRLARLVVIAQDAARHGEQARRFPPDQRLECIRIAGAHGVGQRGFVHCLHRSQS
jgi:hypothetical protein